jgi:hypothetical protein
VKKLASKEFWFMRLIMEDAHIMEAYASAVAEMPLKVGPPKGKPGEEK